MVPQAARNSGRRRRTGAKFFFFFVPGLMIMLFINIWLYAEHYDRRQDSNWHAAIWRNVYQPLKSSPTEEGGTGSGEASVGKPELASRGTGENSEMNLGSGEEGSGSMSTASGVGMAYHLLFMMYPEMPVRALCNVESLVHAVKGDTGSTINMWVDNGRSPALTHLIFHSEPGLNQGRTACHIWQAGTQTHPRLDKRETTLSTKSSAPNKRERSHTALTSRKIPPLDRVGETFMRNSSDLGLDTSMLRIRLLKYEELFRETPLQDFYPGRALDEGQELSEDKYGKLRKQVQS